MDVAVFEVGDDVVPVLFRDCVYFDRVTWRKTIDRISGLFC